MYIKVSIIVAVYNLEKYLHKCIDSILSQSFNDFELILVNDGSTDNSGEMCDYYKSLDHRVRVIHKENGGTASSRNIGLKYAKGEYIGFVDNDDFVTEFMFETLYYHAVKHKADMVICDYFDIEENVKMKEEKMETIYPVIHLNRYEALNSIYTPEGGKFIVPWNKLYKKDLFTNITYQISSIHEDETVAHQLLYECEKITYIKTKLYYYLNRRGSITNSSYDISSFKFVYTLKERVEFFKNKNEVELYKKALKHYYQIFYWNYYKAKGNLKDIDKELSELKRTFDKNLFPLLKHREFSVGQKIYFILFRISPSLYEYGLYIRGRTGNQLDM